MFQRPENKEGRAAPAGAHLKAGQALGSPCGADGGWPYAYPTHLALGVWSSPQLVISVTSEVGDVGVTAG